MKGSKIVGISVKRDSLDTQFGKRLKSDGPCFPNRFIVHPLLNAPHDFEASNGH